MSLHVNKGFWPDRITLILGSCMLICLSCWSIVSQGQSFTNSLANLESLAKADRKLYSDLKSLERNFSKIASVQQSMGQRVTLQQSFPPQLKRYISNYEDDMLTAWGLRPIHALVENPIAVYKLIKRILDVSPQVEKLEKYGFSVQMKRYRKGLQGQWPQQNDLTDAMIKILEIHHVYDINITEFSQGIIFGAPTGVALEASHCYEIGIVAKNYGYLALAVEWLKLTRKKLASVLDDSVTEADADDMIEKAVAVHDSVFSTGDWQQPYLFTTKAENIGDEFESVRELVKRRTFQYKYFKGRKELNYAGINFWALCSGERLQSNKELSQLHCYLDSKSHPVFNLKPQKMEYLHRHPDIIQIHNVLTRRGIKRILSSHGAKDLFDAERNDKNKVEFSSKESKLAKLYSNINIQLQPEEEINGGGSGSLQIFLSNVESGGYTVFPSLAVAVKPKKGSALLYFNDHSDEQIRDVLKFRSCPVVFGRKLVVPINFSQTQRASKIMKAAYVKNNILIKPGIRGSSQPLQFGSAAGLRSLALEEREIYNFIKAVFNSKSVTKRTDTGLEDEEFQCVQEYLNDYEETSGKLPPSNSGSRNSVEFISDNLLPAYRMIWRFKTNLKRMLWAPVGMEKEKGSDHTFKAINEESEAIFKYLQRSYGIAQWPDKTYETDSITAILNLQHVLDLKSDDIANGIIKDIQTYVLLNAKQCHEIGSFAVANQFYSLGVDWLETAMLKINNSDKSIATETVSAELKFSLGKHNRELSGSMGWEPFFFTKPVFLTGKNIRVHRKVEQYEKYKMQDDPSLSEINYWGLCSGKQHQTEVTKSELECWYESELYPHWKIQPLKVELHSQGQFELMQFYDVLDQNAVENLKTAAVPKFNKSSIKSFYDNNVIINPSWRLSVHVSLPRYSNSVSKRISKFSELITGLRDISDPEDLEIASYIPGGHYNVHLDSVSNGEGVEPSRVTSLMYFLSEPTSGGEIAFVQAGVKIKPIQGSVLIWNNLDEWGKLNEMSWHGICPVVQGNLWGNGNLQLS